MDRAMMAKQLTDLLNLRSMPVGIAFPETPPDGVARVESAGPSGCTYWKYAAEGRTFYTTAEDHFNCPIGAYTHNVELPNDRKQELQDVLGVMFSLEYVREEEVPGIPRRESDFHVAVYGPLADSSFKPEIVLICGNAKQLMILSEAANAAGVGESTNFMGRPTCAAIPQAMNTQAGVVNLGCIGNRVYTGMADEELYFALPVEFLPAVVDKLETIVNANRELAKYHQSRLETIGQSWSGANMKKRFGVLAAVGLTLAITAPVGAQVTGGILYVSNTHMSWWGGVARDATSRLYDVDANLTVLDKKIGTITFTAKKGRLVSLDKLHESIWATRLGDRTGMALKVLDVTVTGTATLAGKRMLLRIPGSSDYFELKSHSKGRPKTGQPTYQQLQAALQRGEKTVTVFGQIEGWRGNLTKFLSKVPGRPRRILVKEIKLSK